MDDKIDFERAIDDPAYRRAVIAHLKQGPDRDGEAPSATERPGSDEGQFFLIFFVSIGSV